MSVWLSVVRRHRDIKIEYLYALNIEQSGSDAGVAYTQAGAAG